MGWVGWAEPGGIRGLRAVPPAYTPYTSRKPIARHNFNWTSSASAPRLHLFRSLAGSFLYADELVGALQRKWRHRGYKEAVLYIEVGRALTDSEDGGRCRARQAMS